MSAFGCRSADTIAPTRSATFAKSSYSMSRMAGVSAAVGSVDTAGSGAGFGEEGFFLSFLSDFGGAAAASAVAAVFATASASAMAGGNSRSRGKKRIARAHGLAFDEAVERGARVGLAHTHLREELGALLGHHARED